MGSVRVMPDSTCDLSPELIGKHGISVVPLYVIFNGDSFRDGIDIKTDELYKMTERLNTLTVRNARITAQEFPEGRIEVIDSRNLSAGIGLLVMKAVDFAGQGLGISEIEEGKMILEEKIRGKKEKALKSMLENTLADRDIIDTRRVFVTHSLAEEEAVYLKSVLEQRLEGTEIITASAGCVISSHCGRGTTGILYMRSREV